jgi:hypothetical protein
MIKPKRERFGKPPMERFRGGVRGETQCLVNYVPRFSDEMTVRS